MDPCNLSLSTAQITRYAGYSLAHSLYSLPCTVTLQGELGAGKTTFLQGLAQGLGIDQPVTSPTYALEQRYHTAKGWDFLHLDLYRLTETQALELLHGHDDSSYGIRCIEWPERLGKGWEKQLKPLIKIQLEEEGSGRQLRCAFDDCPLPSKQEIDQWRADVHLPSHIVDHCEVVASVCETLGKELMNRGVMLRPLMLRRAADVHDLFRFVDFKEGAEPTEAVTTFHAEREQHQRLWDEYRNRFAGLRHEDACVSFLEQKGYEALGQVVKTHGLTLHTEERSTIEQKLLYYADKRVNGDQIVTLEERFEDFAKRYGKGTITPQQKKWLTEAKAIESELFANDVPVLGEGPAATGGEGARS